MSSFAHVGDSAITAPEQTGGMVACIRRTCRVCWIAESGFLSFASKTCAVGHAALCDDINISCSPRLPQCRKSNFKHFVIAPTTKRSRSFSTIAIALPEERNGTLGPGPCPLLVGAIFCKRPTRPCGSAPAMRASHFQIQDRAAPIHRLSPRHNPARGFSSLICGILV